jgi:hypothetical protein
LNNIKGKTLIRRKEFQYSKVHQMLVITTAKEAQAYLTTKVEFQESGQMRD